MRKLIEHSMETGPEVRSRMLERAARLPPYVRKKQPNCHRCGHEMNRIGINAWECPKCKLDVGR